MRSPPAPSAPLIGDTHIPLRLLHSSRAFSRGHPYVAPAPPPHPRLRQRIPIRFCRHPRPTRACGAPPPPPPGAGSVPGRISGEQPYPGWSRWEVRIRLFPTYPLALDRGDIATGGGADGEGERVPPPLSLTLQTPCFSLPAFLRGIPVYLAGISHLARASLPAHRPPNRTCAPRAASMGRWCRSRPLFHREQRHIRRLAGPREGEQILARQPGDHEPVALNPV